MIIHLHEGAPPLPHAPLILLIDNRYVCAWPTSVLVYDTEGNWLGFDEVLTEAQRNRAAKVIADAMRVYELLEPEHAAAQVLN